MVIIFFMRQRKDDKKKTFQTLSLITQLGLVMIVSVGMASALGIWLDRRMGTSFITVILFFLGAVAGGQGAYRMVKQVFKEEDDECDKTSEKGR